MSTLPARSADQLDVVARANKILREDTWILRKSEPITLAQAEAFMRALSELGWIPQEEGGAMAVTLPPTEAPDA